LICVAGRAEPIPGGYPSKANAIVVIRRVALALQTVAEQQRSFVVGRTTQAAGLRIPRRLLLCGLSRLNALNAVVDIYSSQQLTSDVEHTELSEALLALWARVLASSPCRDATDVEDVPGMATAQYGQKIGGASLCLDVQQTSPALLFEALLQDSWEGVLWRRRKRRLWLLLWLLRLLKLACQRFRDFTSARILTL